MEQDRMRNLGGNAGLAAATLVVCAARATMELYHWAPVVMFYDTTEKGNELDCVRIAIWDAGRGKPI